MNKRLKRNLLAWLCYSIICYLLYLLLMPLKIWMQGIFISLVVGFYAGMLNDILFQLRKMNGEKLD